jgi:putative endonuclease
MSDASDLGKKGEKLAAEHLRKQGYSILAQNYRFSKLAEVDIVATNDKEIVFVEVKTRASNYLNDPAVMVSRKKQKRIFKAADKFLKEKNVTLEWRFDIISIVMNESTTTIEHLEDAFYPTM